MTEKDALEQAPGDQVSDQFGLRILATTDLHMHLLSHNYYTDQPDATTGLVRTATLIRRARAEAEAAGHGVLLVDNGDSLQGTPMGEIAVDHDTRPHPMMQAFAELGYDAFGLGNHDFDFGPDVLTRILRDAPCPALCSNLTDLPNGVQPTARRRFGLPDGSGHVTVGLLSVLPPQTLNWNAHHMADRFVIEDMVDATRRTAAALKKDGCDLVAVLAHTGLDTDCNKIAAENAGVGIAALDDVDAVVTGHTHLHLPGPAHAGLDGVDAERGLVHGTAVVMPGYAGSHLGLIDLTLERKGTGWRVRSSTVSLRAVAATGPDGRIHPNVLPDPALNDALAPLHCETRKVLQTPVGRAERRLHSYFTLFGPDHGLALVASAQAHAMAPFIAAAGLGDLPILSAAAPCKFGARSGPGVYTDVPKGPITLRHISDLNVFVDEIRVLRVTFAEVLEWLEMSASLFLTLPRQGTDLTLLPDDVAGYNFDVLHGLRYRIDPTQPARYNPEGDVIAPDARRVHDVTFNGSPVRPEDPALVVANSYRAGGGGQFRMAMDAPALTTDPIEVFDAIRAYVEAAPEWPRYRPPWRFSDMPGVSVLVETGAGAGGLLDDIGTFQPEDLGLRPDGFRRLRLHL